MRKINFVDGASSETVPVLGNLIASNLVSYANDAAYEASEQGSPIAGNIYYNTTSNLIRFYNGTEWVDVVDEASAQTLENKTIDGTTATGNNTISADADNITYDNSTSSLVATDVQGAVDEVEARVDTNETNISTNATDIANLETLSGEGGATSHAPFPGSTISDNVSTRQALSELEAAVELKLDASEKGAAGGVAELDGSGKVPAAQLPSYVDDVEEYADFASLPVTGEVGKIYITLDDNKIYRWTGSIYVEISPGSVDSVNGQTGVVVLDADDIDDSATTNKFATAAQLDKVDFLTVTSAVDLDALSSDVAANTAKVSADGSIDTHSDVDTTTNAPSVDQALVWDGSNWVPGNVAASGGGGSKNYYSLGDFEEADTSFVSLFNDGGSYVDGTGGTSAGTGFSLEVVSPMAGTTSLNITKPAVDCSGDGVSFLSDAIDLVDRGRNLFCSFEWNPLSYTDGAYFIKAFATGTENAILPVYGVSGLNEDGSLPNYKTKVYFYVPTTANVDDKIRISLFMGTDPSPGSSFTVRIDDIRSGPDQLVPGSIIGPRVEFTPTWNNLSIGDGSQNWVYQRIGSGLRVWGDLAFGSTTSVTGVVSMNLPISNITVDVLGSEGLGSAFYFDNSGGLSETGAIRPLSTSLRLTTQGNRSSVTATAPFTWTSSDRISFDVTVPIVEWSSGAMLSTTETMLMSAKFYASLVSTWSNATGTALTVVPFDTADVDNLNGFNSSTGEYTIPRSGFYSISSIIITSALSPAGTNFTVNIYKNGGLLTRVDETNSSSNPDSVIHWQGPLLKDDIIDIRVVNGSDATFDVSTSSHFSIVEHPDFSTFSVYGESETLSSESSAFPLSTAGFASGEWAQMVGNSLDLTVGEWLLSGSIKVLDGTGTGLSDLLAQWSSANGDNTTTQPAPANLSAGLNRIRHNRSLTDEDFPLSTVKMIVTSPTTVYMVPRINFTSAGTAELTTYIFAQRIK